MFTVLYNIFFRKLNKKSNNSVSTAALFSGNSINCSSCGKPISDKHTYCSYCGVKQNSKAETNTQEPE